MENKAALGAVTRVTGSSSPPPPPPPPPLPLSPLSSSSLSSLSPLSSLSSPPPSSCALQVEVQPGEVARLSARKITKILKKIEDPVSSEGTDTDYVEINGPCIFVHHNFHCVSVYYVGVVFLSVRGGYGAVFSHESRADIGLLGCHGIQRGPLSDTLLLLES